MDFKKEIHTCLEVLESGGLIVYPTDTVWGIGCAADNQDAVSRIYELKKRPDSKSMICLVANDAMLERHVEKVPDLAFDLMDLSEKPLTIIYDSPKGIAPNLIAGDNTLAIRVTKDPFCKNLISRLKIPLVSTSANLAGMPTPKSFREIDPAILKGVDYVVNLQREGTQESPSSIIKLASDGSVKVIRE